MTRQEKFKALDSFITQLGLSENDLRTYCQDNIILSSAGKINTPCPVVYKNTTGGRDTLPYLDLFRKEEVEGAICADYAIIKNSQEGGYDDAEKFAKAQHGYIFRKEQYMLLYKDINRFNATMAIFRQNGIPADDWQKKWHWCEEVAYQHAAVVYNMGSGDDDFFSKSFGNCKIRIGLKL